MMQEYDVFNNRYRNNKNRIDSAENAPVENFIPCE
jgi:hypothetical protein